MKIEGEHTCLQTVSYSGIIHRLEQMGIPIMVTLVYHFPNPLSGFQHQKYHGLTTAGVPNLKWTLTKLYLELERF